jgi:hypothetical protein
MLNPLRSRRPPTPETSEDLQALLQQISAFEAHLRGSSGDGNGGDADGSDADADGGDGPAEEGAPGGATPASSVSWSQTLEGYGLGAMLRAARAGGPPGGA